MAPRLKPTAPSSSYPLSSLQTAALCKDMDAFLRTPSYFVLLGFLTVFSVMRSLELVTYTIFVLIGIFIALLGSDLLPLMPLVVLSYITPSPINNPGTKQTSVFFGSSGTYILIIAILFVGCLLFRLCLDPEIGKMGFLKTKRSLLPGMFLLGGGYMLAGAFSGYYTANGWYNALFGMLQFLSVFLPYFLFTGGVRWKKTPKDYLAWIGVCVGLVLVAQLMHIYHVNRVIRYEQIIRDRIYSGWGNYNNISALLTMTIPFAFQLICRKKGAWFFELIALLLLGGVVMTCSRGSLLVALAVYGGCFILMLRKSLHSPTFLPMHGVIFAAVVLGGILFHNQLLDLFSTIINRGLNSTGRDVIYLEGLKQFLSFPIFGGSFYPVGFSPNTFASVDAFIAIFPPRWHNTLIQLLATCGITGVLAYGYHRYQTVKLMLKAPTLGKIFISISLLALLATSLVDCHFFNIGPVLFYSMALAFAEKANTQTIKQDKTRR